MVQDEHVHQRVSVAYVSISKEHWAESGFAMSTLVATSKYSTMCHPFFQLFVHVSSWYLV